MGEAASPDAGHRASPAYSSARKTLTVGGYLRDAMWSKALIRVVCFETPRLYSGGRILHLKIAHVPDNVDFER